MFLVNYADGVKGHYCIGREIDNYWVFWNSGDMWAGSGQVFFNRKDARDKLKEIKAKISEK